ncbi:MAG: carboxypeptidase-like regulatory domain-containing protein [Sphingobacteriales bacterium]|nr:MAG: carboxypeptidase-like regulatory domain-containing protein [Sphingobacteriales bacterium]
MNNSTFGTICGNDGTFTLTQHPAFPFTLTISSVGYQSVSRSITNEDAARNLLIRLTAKQQDLGEVTVRPPEKNGWELYGKTFLQEFIGYSDFAGQCTILNKKDLQFAYDPESFQLRVWSQVPLKIRNKATGYEITYWLEDFKLDQLTHRLYYRGLAQFRDLQPDKPKQKYIRNRHSAYQGSINHFMRALYQRKAAAEGFELRTLLRMTEDEAAALQPRQTDTIAVTDSIALARLLHTMYDGTGTNVV